MVSDATSKSQELVALEFDERTHGKALALILSHKPDSFVASPGGHAVVIRMQGFQELARLLDRHGLHFKKVDVEDLGVLSGEEAQRIRREGRKKMVSDKARDMEWLKGQIRALEKN